MTYNKTSCKNADKWEDDPEGYIKNKLKILTRDFCIKPREEELEIIRNCKNQVQVDNAIFNIINSRY